MPLFDSYLMVDWSAASVPTKGPNSIWIGHHRAGRTEVENIPTRHAAVERIREIAHEVIAQNLHILIGFDFPFGYPKGVAQHLCGSASALDLWDWLAARIEDAPDNSNNRFDVADRINGDHFDGIGPFWGRPEHWCHPEIPTKASARSGTDHPAERRLADIRAKGAKTVWQLAYSGSVGSQVLLGLPALTRIRRAPELGGKVTIWPFESGLAEPEGPVVLAEIYPSLIPPDPDEPVKDAGQVRAVADWLAKLDATGSLAPLFSGPTDVTAEERHLIATEEAWILGLNAQSRTTVQTGLRYERDPAEIYRQSFATVRAEADLDHLPETLHDLAIRLIHASGMPEIAARLAWGGDPAGVGHRALASGAPILCDCEAVASMIIRPRLPASNPVICTLNDPRTPALSQEIRNTRSAAAVELWQDKLEGAVVAIGNAPTALFHLLELIDSGWPRPAAVFAFPVGFVGAAESKAELAANPRNLPFLTLRGRRGGSAMAAAALNATAAGLQTAV